MRPFALAFALTVLAGCQGAPETAVVAGTGGYRVERLFTVDGCTAYRFNDGRTVHFVNCGATTQTSWTETCGKNCTRSANVSTTNSGVNAENPEPRGDGPRMDGATNDFRVAATPAATRFPEDAP